MFRAQRNSCRIRPLCRTPIRLGNETDKREISIDGKKLEITASLDCALRHIRDRHSRMIRIWADGICINQSGVDDRNPQVAQMGSV